MDEKERQFQHALGTFDYYIVTLEIARRSGKPIIYTEIVEEGNEHDAFEKAVQQCMKRESTVRRDQIKLKRCHKFNR